MTALIVGSEARLPDGVRAALRDLADHEVGDALDRVAVVIVDPAVAAEAWRESLATARNQHPDRWLLVVGPPAAFSLAVDAGADDVVAIEATLDEVKARLRLFLDRFRHLRRAVRDFPSPVALFDRAGVHQVVSDGYGALFDLPERVIIGRPLADIVPGLTGRLPGPDRAGLTTFMVDVAGEVEPRRLLFVCVDTSEGIIAFVHHDAEATDVSDRLRVASQARRLMTLGGVSMGLAHDFNNLLTVILGNAAFLKDELVGSANGQRLLRDLEHSATRAGDLTEQILRYASSAEEPAHAIDVNVLVRDVGPFLRALVAPSAELRLELADAHLEVDAEASGMTQLLVNLVQNAAEATTDPRGEVVIRTGTAQVTEELADRLEPRYSMTGPLAVFVEVEDNGQGILPATVSQIFEPFFSTRGHGRGLGLSVVRDVARSHGGGVEVVSEPGAGTRARVWLPPAAGANINPEPSVSVSAERWSSRGLVLVADDEPEVRGLLHRILVTSGFQVLEAEDGDAALELVQAHPSARLLILDLTMPRLDGAEVVRRLAARGRTLPVVMMSGYSFAQAKARLSSLDVAGFIKKPFLPGAVMAKVKRVLGE